ncbi:MFS transporter [Neobacillus kokaensis]|uniref:MFS transporter n=1 Tax=Neobacillus kokaensis TaxID=2759023 RepID=A0ABQ3N6Z6_9BACI|nr:MFS transporter [Neobacillus kokaensis]GHH99934.1 MFS transporter [Neobacillus kokaensis]
MRWMILVFLFFGTLLNFADKSVAGYAAVPIINEFNLSYTQWGLVGSSFFWLFAVSGVFGSALSDRFGTKKVLAILVLSWVFIQSGAFAVKGLTGLILMRVLLGAFEGPYFATAANHITKWFPPERRSFAIAIMNSGGTVGALVIAPLLVAGIEGIGWRETYGSLGLLGVIWFILWIWKGKEKPEHENFARVETQSAPKIKGPEIYRVLLSRSFILVCLAVFASYWFLAWIQTFLPAYFVKSIHLSPKEMGNYASILGIVSATGTLLIAWFSDRLYKKSQNLRRSRVFVGGGGVILAGFLFYSITIIHHPIYVLVVMCVGKSMTSAMFVLWPPIATSLLPQRGGLILGVGSGFAQLAGIIGPIVTGAIVESSGSNVGLGFDHAILFVGTLLVLFGALFLLFCKPDKQAGTLVYPLEGKTVS